MKKIVVLESYLQYVLVIGYAIMLGLSQFMIGMCLMACIIMSSCNKSYDVHHWYCFFGGQVLFGEGIMAFNYADGWASSLPMRYRRVIHPVLQVGGTCYYFYGSLAAFGTGRNMTDPHAIVGILSFVLIICNFVFGWVTLFKRTSEDTKGSKIHVALGVLTYMMITISTCLGFRAKLFDQYVRLAYMAEGNSKIMFIVLTAFYSFAILVRPIKRLLNKYTYQEPK